MKRNRNIGFLAVSAALGFMLAVQYKTVAEPEQRDTRDIWELKADGTVTVGKPDTFTAVLVLEGEGTIDGEAFGRYDTFFIPADAGEVKLSGCFKALLSTL